MGLSSVLLTEEDKKAVRAVLPAVRRTSPQAAKIIRRLMRATTAGPVATMRPYVSVREVAAAFSVTDQTVRNWVDRGWLPAERKFGRGPRRIPRSVLSSADALSRPRPSVRDFTPEQVEAILRSPRRAKTK